MGRLDGKALLVTGAARGLGEVVARLGVGQGAYGASKWALRGMTKIAAQELGPLNIRVNSVHPGGIRTEMSKGVSAPGVELTPDQVKMRWALNRFPELAEVANVILFLASEEATYTTGAEITCDGGATIGPRYV